MDESKPVRFKVTEDRTELLPLGVYRRMNTDPDAQMYFLAHFLVDPDTGAYFLSYDPGTGVYVDGVDRAWEVLDRLPVFQIKELMAELMESTEDLAVPKA